MSLRVLHVLEAVRGGTSRHLVDVVRTASKIEHHVAIPALRTQLEGRSGAAGALTDVPALAALVTAGAVTHYIDMRRNPLHPANAIAVVNVARLIRQTRPAIVHGHSSVGGAVARLAARSVGVPAVYTPNGLAPGDAAVAIERMLGRATTRLVAVSASEAALVETLGLVPRSRVVEIPNGIDLHQPATNDIDLRARFGLAPGTPLVGTVARLVAQKSPELFARLTATVAAARQDAHFVLIGMGPLQRAVDAVVDAAPVLAGRFHQIHHLADAAGVLNQLDVFVLASRFEGGPYTPLEAMRAGVPVVLSDVVGSRDTVVNGVSGLLYPWGDVGAMAEGVSGLLDDASKRASLVAGGSEALRDRFDVQLMGAALERLYGQIS